MGFSREASQSFVKQLKQYETIKLTGSWSGATLASSAFGYSHEQDNIAACQKFIRRISAIEDIAGDVTRINEEYLNLLIELGQTADAIQRNTKKSTSQCCEFLHKVRHDMLHAIRSTNATPKASADAVDAKATPSIRDAYEQKIQQLRALYKEQKKQLRQARLPKKAEQIQKETEQQLIEIKAIERELDTTVITLAYLGKTTLFRQQPQAFIESNFPPATAWMKYPQFEYASTCKAHGVDGLSPVLPLVMQPQFPEVFQKKYNYELVAEKEAKQSDSRKGGKDRGSRATTDPDIQPDTTEFKQQPANGTPPEGVLQQPVAPTRLDAPPVLTGGTDLTSKTANADPTGKSGTHPAQQDGKAEALPTGLPQAVSVPGLSSQTSGAEEHKSPTGKLEVRVVSDSNLSNASGPLTSPSERMSRSHSSTNRSVMDALGKTDNPTTEPAPALTRSSGETNEPGMQNPVVTRLFSPTNSSVPASADPLGVSNTNKSSAVPQPLR